MTTETVNIIVRESGARVVKRKFDEIGESARRATRGLRFLQNALWTLGAAGTIKGITHFLDILANFENRLRLVTNSTAEFNAVQKELFDLASRTRGEFESTAQIYTRVALAVKGYGYSQRDVLNFTESLNKAVILSGANVREANAAIIQLAQGMASGRLNGDELRSVLEQLPFAADVIAKHLGISRGEMRKWGRDGKITAQVVMDAFAAAAADIDAKFAQTVPTIGQSLQKLRTEFMRVLDRFDDVTGSSAGVARAIIGIANSLEFLVAGIMTGATAFGTWKLAQFIASLEKARQFQNQLTLAVKNGNATMLTATGIESARAATMLKSAEAARLSAAAKAFDARRDVAQLVAQRALLLQQQQHFVLDTRRKIARDALSGSFVRYNVALEHNIRTNIALSRTETALAAARSQLSAATAGRIATENAYTAAQVRSTAAAAASNTWSARLAATFPTTTAALRGLAAGFGVLWAVMLANPAGAVIAAIVGLVAALGFFSDKIAVTADGVVTLQDTAVATFQLIAEAAAPMVTSVTENLASMINYFSVAFRSLYTFMGSILGDLLEMLKVWINQNIGFWVGLVNGIIAAWDILPAALKDIAILAMNGLIDVMQEGAKKVAGTIGQILQGFGFGFEAVGMSNPFVGMSKKMADAVDLSGFKKETTGAAREAASAFQTAFTRDIGVDYIGNAWGAILERAREIAEKRIANLDERGVPGILPGDSGDGKGGGKGGREKDLKTFEELIAELIQENELLKVNASEREKLNAILGMERELKRSLTTTERELAYSLLQENEVLTEAARIFEDINGPASQYKLTLEALNQLMDSGRISADQFNGKLAEARMTFLETQTSFNAGLERGMLKLMESSQDAASAAESLVTRSFDTMAEGLTDLVLTGKMEFKDLTDSILRDVVRLMMNKLVLKLFNSILDPYIGAGKAGGSAPTAGGGIGAALVGFGKSLFGFQHGGAFRVGGVGGPDSQLVAFKASPNERVSIETPAQQNRGANVTVNVFNNSTATATKTERSDSNGRSVIDIVIEEARNAVAMDIARGGSNISKGLENRYGLNPARGNKL